MNGRCSWRGKDRYPGRDTYVEIEKSALNGRCALTRPINYTQLNQHESAGLFVGRVFGLYGGRRLRCAHAAGNEAGGETGREEKGATDLGSVGGNWCDA